MTRSPFFTRARARAVVLAAVTAAGIGLTIAGCAPQPAATTAPSSSSSSASADGSGGASVDDANAVLVPGGTAEENLPFFDKVNRATLAANPDAKGRDFIDALVNAGFTKTDMQLTVDTTTIGLKANSIQFSVKMGDTCLIGQNGADAGGYNSMVTPLLATGTCLIGETRAIDW